MTTPINNNALSGASSGASSAASATSGIGSLDPNAFLELLTAQLANQNPLQPVDDTQFVTQLAQFTAVQQATQTNTELTTMSSQLTGISNNDAVGLVGKQVTVSGSQLAFDGSDP